MGALTDLGSVGLDGAGGGEVLHGVRQVAHALWLTAHEPRHLTQHQLRVKPAPSRDHKLSYIISIHVAVNEEQ